MKSTESNRRIDSKFLSRTAMILNICFALTMALAVTPLQARVTRIVIDEIRPLPADASGGIAFEQLAGRAFGELDPGNVADKIIQDIELAKDADDKVRYVATFKNVVGHK